ncbi:MAG: UvrB/UvrC motif-containing protein [Symbiobacteriaceae bacterium]|nr:UvrB/UvrC motif-containing protein [Symbiobacteriaceae bacterium]
MLCQECQQETATVHAIQFSQGKTSERHLCEACAKKAGLKFGEEFFNFSVTNLLAGLLDAQAPSTPEHQQQQQSVTERCPRCGISYRRFHRTGRLGCAECYQAFSQHLEPLLRRVQGATLHRGKLPLRGGKSAKLRRQIQDLRLSLQRAVEEERYEVAASLRDQIRTLEKEGESLHD